MAKYNFQISYAPSRPRSSRRTATASSVTSVAAAPAVDISGKLDKAEFYKYFEEVNIGTAEAPVYATRSKRGLFSDSFLSALGLNPNTGGGGGASYDRLDAWDEYTSERAGWVLSAALGYELHNRVSSLESSIVPDLSEYATRTWVQQQGYATSAALAAHAGDAAIHISSAERTLWNKTAADFAAIVGEDSDDIINKWEEVVAFLDTYTEADTLANLLSNKVDKVAGYGLSKNDFTDALLSKLNGIDAGANRYVHPTGGADASIGDAAGRVLSGITVNALGHVTSVSSKTLAAADIPTLAISKVSGLQDALDGKLDKAVFDSMFELVNEGTTSAPKYAIRAKYGLYSDGFLSAKGLNSSGGGGEGGGSYDRLDAWSDYTADKAGWVLSAALGYDLHSRVRSLEGGSALSFTTEGSGNVVTAVKKSGTSVIVTKGLTALTSHQPIYSLAFQAGAFEAKTYTPNTGVQTVNVPTKTSHLSNDSGFITAATANATFATKLGVSGTQIGTYVNGKLDNLITVPYATNADKVDGYDALRLQRDIYTYLRGDNIADSTTDPNTLTGGTGISGFRFYDTKFYASVSASAKRTQIAYPYNIIANIQYRVYSTEWSAWKTVANIDDNVASATKLQTARTLWGNSFNGEQNIGGDIIFDRGKNNRLLKITKDGILRLDAGTGAWSFALNTYSDGGDIQIGSIGTLGSGNEIIYWYIGKSHEDPKLVITPSGNVGIGTTSPAYKLDVIGTISGNGEARFSNGVYSDPAVGVSCAMKISQKLAVGGDAYFATLSGNVGIGTTSPAYKLDVAGVIHATTGIFSDSYMSAKGINTASDARLKRRMGDVALTVRDVAEAPVYRFAWINGGGIDVGSTAQYWAARVPELTHSLPDGIHLGLDYGKAALLSVVAVARATADHERRIADIERQLQNITI